MFDNEKLLMIEPGFIEFDNNRWSKQEIAELCYGVKGIRGYSFVIGRIYCIDIKNTSGNIIKIRLKSLYRVRRKQLGEKYRLILSTLFENFINDISLSFIEKFKNKVEFTILGVTFTQEGIIFGNLSETISWFDLGTRNYRTYYSLFSNQDPRKYKTFQYLTDWNTVVLYSVSRSILKLKGLL
jgi:hypothetical protein